MKLRALRGAITVDGNDAGAILDRTEELVREVMERNSLAPERHGELHLHLHRATSTPSSLPWPRASWD